MKRLVNKVVCEDCFQFLPKLPDAIFDLAIIDPPYNMKKARWDTFRGNGYFLDFTEDWIKSFIPKMKKDGSFYIFNTPYNCAKMLPILEQSGATLLNWITWNKQDGFSGGTRRYAPRQETILFCSLGGKHYFDSESVREPYLSAERMEHAAKKGILKNGRRWFPNGKGRLCDDVWAFSSHRHKSKVNGRVVAQPHPTPKPEDMIERMILASSKKGQLVLDLFSGTGTTSFVCLKHGRKFIGCENDDKMFPFISERIGDAHTKL